MPAALDSATRSDIVYYAALGYTQREIAARVGVSRNSVRKYLERARDAVEAADDSRATLCAIVEDEYDWDERSDGSIAGIDFLSM